MMTSEGGLLPAEPKREMEGSFYLWTVSFQYKSPLNRETEVP